MLQGIVLAVMWKPLAVAFLTTSLLYIFLIAAIRFIGRRQTAQLTVIDFLVVLLLGSAVETSLIHGNTTLPVGLVSVVTLLGINKALTIALLHSKRFRHLVNGGPTVIVKDGVLLEEHLRRAGFTDEDAMAAIRGRGYADLSQVRYAVLETDGTVSVIPAGGAKPKQ